MAEMMVGLKEDILVEYLVVLMVALREYELVASLDEWMVGM